MEYLKLCDSDYRFMLVVWEHAPVNSGTLVKLCSQVLGWKKSTTYTTIKKLSEKGYIKNENAVVSALIGKERVQRDESAYFVERTFGGSLPQFLAAFLGGKKITFFLFFIVFTFLSLNLNCQSITQHYQFPHPPPTEFSAHSEESHPLLPCIT